MVKFFKKSREMKSQQFVVTNSAQDMKYVEAKAKQVGATKVRLAEYQSPTGTLSRYGEWFDLKVK